jgi:PrtD family type I secretion system ABC transporter
MVFQMTASRSSEKKKTQLERALSDTVGVFASVGLFSFFINALMLTVPFYMLQIYDRVLVSSSEHTLLMLTIVAVFLLLALGLLDLARSRVLVRVGARLDGRLSKTLISSMLSKRLSGYGSENQPIRDLDILRGFLTGPGLLAFFDAPWTPLFVMLIFVFHPLLGFVAVAGVVVLFSLALFSEFITRKAQRKSSEFSIQANEFADSSLRNAEVIQGMGMLPGLLRVWYAKHEAGLGFQAIASDRAAGVSSAAKIIRQLLQVGILAIGAYLAIQQIITPGVMIVASIILARALAPIEMAINSWRGFISARSAYGRLKILLSETDVTEEPMALPKPVGELSVEGVVAVPPGGKKPVIKGVSFSLDVGEILAIVGPSASGKSTLARLLVGIWAPNAGHVRLDAADVSQWNREALGPHIGYVPQDVELFDGTVSDNIARFNEPDAQLVVEAARKAGVHEMILRLSDGYDTRIGEAGSVLSGGQRQRIALARALYGDPVFIVLDEPNSNMDGEGEEALRNTLKVLKQAAKTIVVIAHRPSIIQAADKILVLREGQIDQFGTTTEVMQRLGRSSAPLQPVATGME